MSWCICPQSCVRPCRTNATRKKLGHGLAPSVQSTVTPAAARKEAIAGDRRQPNLSFVHVEADSATQTALQVPDRCGRELLCGGSDSQGVTQRPILVGRGIQALARCYRCIL